jgi:hypothetical protein
MSQDTLIEIIRCATLAPSGHNTQPWKFALQGQTVRILPDFTRRLPVVDPDDRELYISLGCALENLRLAAQQNGFQSLIDYFPAEDSDCLRVKLQSEPTLPADPLFDAIARRQCTRSEYNGKPVPPADLKRLVELPLEADVSLNIFSEAGQIDRLVEAINAGNRQQFTNPDFMDELITWIRFNEAEATRTQDGLFSRCSGNPTVPRWIGKLFLKMSGADSTVKSDEKKVRSSAGMAVIATQADDRAAWVKAGQVYERFALTAASMTVRNAFMNQPVEVPELRAQLQNSMDLGAARPQLVLRFGYAEEMPRSLRRPVNQVTA